MSLISLCDAVPTHVCVECLGDPVLQKRFATNSTAGCLACGRSEHASASVSELASLIRVHAQDHYELDPGLYSGYSGLSLERVIALMLDCHNEPVLAAVVAELVEPDKGEDPPAYFAHGNEYRRTQWPFESQEDERRYVVRRWETIEEDLVHSNRYFNKNAASLFEELFNEALKTQTNTLFGPRPAAVGELRTGQILYRARLANSDLDRQRILANPAQEMGAPPRSMAKTNRMSPAGVPRFYAATSKITSIAEVRPAIGDCVAVARFTATQPLKLFDFRGLDRYLRPARVSPFDERSHEQRELQLFLSYLHQEIAKPVRNEGTSYIVTQALTEYLASFMEDFGAMAFESVQHKGGTNIVLFGRDEMTALGKERTFPAELAGDVQFFDVHGVHYDMDPPPY
jgi:hypothetical protein